MSISVRRAAASLLMKKPKKRILSPAQQAAVAKLRGEWDRLLVMIEDRRRSPHERYRIERQQRRVARRITAIVGA